MKLSRRDRTQLDRLLEARAADLLKVTGERMSVTAASYLRWLMDRDAKARGIDVDEVTPARPAALSPPKKKPEPQGVRRGPGLRTK